MIFLDTNIWNYALLSQDAEKKQKATRIVGQALVNGGFAISTQVMSECASILKKKSLLPPAEIIRAIHFMTHVKKVVQITPEIVIRAVELQSLYSLSLYDAQIIAAAESADCTEIWSEDLQDKALYAGIRCINPFALA